MKTARTTQRSQGYPGPSWQWSNWSNRSKRPNIFQRLRRIALRRRRLLAALLLCLAAAIAVQQLTPSAPATVEVLVTVRDLPAGHTLAHHDVTMTAVAPVIVPDGAFASAPLSPAIISPAINGQPVWLGRQLSGPVRRGEVLTDASMLGNELLIGSPPGTQAVPVRVSDPATLSLLSQGQLVTVVLSRSETMAGPVQNEILAIAVPVLWTPELAQSSSGLLPAQNVEGMVVVAASGEQALQLAGASTHGKVFLILVPQDSNSSVAGSPG
ncbi:RcpC/CpaB family pilus assembly protein [Specibacter sp. NPDC078709]|uniref:RcpC/CpaB family pilus assembly protein n=1 Tax=Specibacter sp. NPDC078709 TaxID=3154364 RepID=UPI003443D7AE